MKLKQNQYLKLDAFGPTLDILWTIIGVPLECFGHTLDILWMTLDDLG